MSNFPINILVYTFTYNNQDILPFVIDYWKLYATKVVVYDNNSSDNTVNILKQYDWIEIRTYSTDNTYDPDTILAIKNECYKECRSSNVDYVMICDIDEVLYYGDKLLDIIKSYKDDNVQIIKTLFYNLVCNRLPNYNNQLLLKYSDIKYNERDINKVVLFNPNCKIKFIGYKQAILDNSYIQSKKPLYALHFKYIGFDRLKVQYKLYKERYKGNNIVAVLEHQSIINCIQYYNSMQLASVSAVHACSKLDKELSSIETTIVKDNSKSTVTVSLEKITWKPAQIEYNSKKENYDCVIAIPVYKTALNNIEWASLRQAVNVLGDKYNIVLFGPESLDFDFLSKSIDYKFNVLKCNEKYFKSISTYSTLCETKEFYESFKDYKFLLIYQLDGWIFKDQLNKYIALDYDYIGAPWNAGFRGADRETVGNGGVSLRKVNTFISLCEKITDEDLKKECAGLEDIFFTRYMKSKYSISFDIAPVAAAYQFCIDELPSFWFNRNECKLPMCVHRVDRDFWKKYVDFNNKVEKKEETAVVAEPAKEIIKEEKPEKQTAISIIKEDINVIKEALNKSVDESKADIKVALCAIAKNENRYIREWVEYYKKLGIDKIFLYDNNDLDGERFDEVIDDYIKSGFVEVIDKRGVEKGLVYDANGINLLTSCYIDCYENRVKDFNWIAFFDIDEFLTFKNNISLHSFLTDSKFNNFDTVLVQWKTYDDNGLLRYENKPVMERFTHLSTHYLKGGFKSIVRTNKQIADKKQVHLIHKFNLQNYKVCYANGQKDNTGHTDWAYKTVLESNVYLNHYKTKSFEEYLERLVGRHWGTTKRVTSNCKTIDNVIKDYYTYNDKSVIKLEFSNNYIKTYKSVDVYMASIWRSGYVINSIKSIIYLFQVKTLILSANNFTDELVKQLIDSIHSSKLIIKRTNNEKASMEKLRFINEGTSKYVAFCDDDLQYPNDYFSKLIDKCEKYNSPVTYHGSIFNSKLPLSHYYQLRTVYPFFNNIEKDTKVDVIGNGVSLFKREYLTNEEYRLLYDEAPNISMDDITVSYALRKKGYSLYVISHKKGEIIAKKEEPTDKSTFKKYKNDDSIQTNWVNTYYKNL